MPPKKKDGKAGADEEEPSEEAKDLLEKELVISYLKMKLAACAPFCSPPLCITHMNLRSPSVVRRCSLPVYAGLFSQAPAAMSSQRL